MKCKNCNYCCDMEYMQQYEMHVLRCNKHHETLYVDNNKFWYENPKYKNDKDKYLHWYKCGPFNRIKQIS